MKSTVIPERLNSIRNEMTHLWGSVFVLGGGSIALFLGEFSVRNFVLGFVGVMLTILMFNTYFLRRIELQKMIKDLEEES